MLLKAPWKQCLTLTWVHCVLLVWENLNPDACDFVSVSNSSHQGISDFLPLLWKALCWQMQPFKICLPNAGSRLFVPWGEIVLRNVETAKEMVTFHPLFHPAHPAVYAHWWKIGRGEVREGTKKGALYSRMNYSLKTWHPELEMLREQESWTTLFDLVGSRRWHWDRSRAQANLCWAQVVAVKECQDGPDSPGLLGCLLLPSPIS